MNQGWEALCWTWAKNIQGEKDVQLGVKFL